MIDNCKILSIITARGGSKGLPGKNIRTFCGKPLIYWTIASAQGSRYIDDVFVSTDSEKIADIVRATGVDVPIFRPPELATDTAASIDVVLHALEWCEVQNSVSYDYVILLEPTSPLRKKNDIDKALVQLHAHHSASTIVGVCRSESQHPAFQVKKDDDGYLHPLTNEYQAVRRQDISQSFFYEGSVYIAKVPALKKQKSFITKQTLGYEVEKWQSFEIDDAIDFMICELLMNAHIAGQI
jgi:CMP-N,N'-diacetyllegionaminic acid synthase